MYLEYLKQGRTVSNASVLSTSITGKLEIIYSLTPLFQSFSNPPFKRFRLAALLLLLIPLLVTLHLIIFFGSLDITSPANGNLSSAPTIRHAGGIWNSSRLRFLGEYSTVRVAAGAGVRPLSITEPPQFIERRFRIGVAGATILSSCS